VTASTPTTYEFRAFLVNQQSGGTAGQSAAVEAVWQSGTRPKSLKLLFNGKSLPTEPLVGGADNYRDIPAGKTRIEARWTNDARGYDVVISMIEPAAKIYASCAAGTSCLVPQRVTILVDQETSWSVRLLRKGSHKLVTGFKVCLVGRA
jgi:hypothetical protein